MTSRAPTVGYVEWKCDICGESASFQLGPDASHLCADHWRLTPHCVGIQIDAAKNISDKDNEK